MKIKIHHFTLLLLFSLLFTNCEKQQVINNTYPSVVGMAFSITSTKSLEFFYNDELIGTRNDTGTDLPSFLPIEGEYGLLEVKEAETGKLVKSEKILPSPASQTFTLYYDGTNAYDALLYYNLDGYALSGTLEFVVDDEVLLEGSTAIKETLEIYLNEGEIKELIVRKQGEADALLSQTIDANSTETLRFFFDGTAIIDQLPELTPPTISTHMAIQAQFTPNFTGSLPPTFLGGNEVDLKFFIRSTATNNSGTVTDPNIRITVPTDGTFVTFELPPLPDEASVYTFDICLKGTDEIAYSGFTATYPPEQSKGRYGVLNIGSSNEPKYFEGGATKMLLLGPTSSIKTSTPRARYVYGYVIQELSQYFTTETPSTEEAGGEESTSTN